MEYVAKKLFSFWKILRQLVSIVKNILINNNNKIINGTTFCKMVYVPVVIEDVLINGICCQKSRFLFCKAVHLLVMMKDTVNDLTNAQGSLLHRHLL